MELKALNKGRIKAEKIIMETGFWVRLKSLVRTYPGVLVCLITLLLIIGLNFMIPAEDMSEHRDVHKDDVSQIH